MKRIALLSVGLALLMMATTAVAQPVVTTTAGLAVWYDVRPTAAEITTAPVAPFTRGQSLFSNVFGKGNVIENVAAGNFGGPGDGQVLRISPRQPLNPNGNGFGCHVTGTKKNGFIDQSIKNLYAYITVEPSGPGTEQVIAALGRDTDVVKASGAGVGNPIEAIAVTMDAGPWSPAGTSATTTGPVLDDFTLLTKAVKVPVTGTPPVYNATGGAIPTGVFRVSCIEVTAGVWNKGSAKPNQSTYTVTDRVNNLLITRVVKTGGPAPAELPDFGYTTVESPPASGLFFTGNGPEAGTGTGSVIGTTSATEDATIVIQMKGDFNDDGTINSGDVTAFGDAVLAEVAGTIRQRWRYLGDFNNSNTVNSGDIAAFQNCLLAALGDCIPATDCPVSTLGGPGCP